ENTFGAISATSVVNPDSPSALACHPPAWRSSYTMCVLPEMRTSYFMARGPVAPADLPVSNGKRFLYRRMRQELARRSALPAKRQRRWLRPLWNRFSHLPAERTKSLAAAATIHRAIGCESRRAESRALRESAGTARRWFECP